MSSIIKGSSITLLISIISFATFSSESEILRAAVEGKLNLSSKISVPKHTNKAILFRPTLPGDTSSHLPYAISAHETRTINDKAYPLISAKWPFNLVPTCWEDPETLNPEYMQLVQQAVEETWAKHSSLEFFGWKKCSEKFTGVRIGVFDDENEGAHVKYLGKYLAYDSEGNQTVVKNGMVLNFTFQNWNTGCQTAVEYCIRTIAVHEFGHAIGFAHEQNRPDTPDECTKAPQGTSGDTLLTPWDPESVMNYCNRKYNNNGVLSDFDIKAVSYIYGVS